MHLKSYYLMGCNVAKLGQSLKMDVEGSSDTSVGTYQTSRNHTTEYSTIQGQNLSFIVARKTNKAAYVHRLYIATLSYAA